MYILLGRYPTNGTTNDCDFESDCRYQEVWMKEFKLFSAENSSFNPIITDERWEGTYALD